MPVWMPCNLLNQRGYSRPYLKSYLHAAVKDQVDLCERTADPTAPKDCPLCNETLGSSKPFHKHVAKHLVEVALFTLRDDCDDQSNDEGEDDDSDSPSEYTTDSRKEAKVVISLPRRVCDLKQWRSPDRPAIWYCATCRAHLCDPCWDLFLAHREHPDSDRPPHEKEQ